MVQPVIQWLILITKQASEHLICIAVYILPPAYLLFMHIQINSEYSRSFKEFCGVDK